MLRIIIFSSLIGFAALFGLGGVSSGVATTASIEEWLLVAKNVLSILAFGFIASFMINIPKKSYKGRA